MSKTKKRKQNIGIVGSYARTQRMIGSNRGQADRARFADKIAKDAVILDSQISQENGSPSSAEDNIIVLKENEPLDLGYSQEELDERRREVFEGELSLDANVKQLFELTRDGKPTPSEYKNKLLQPEVKAEDMFDAIKLGIKAWAPSLLSKER
jgi:hypothetical protein